MPVTSPERSRQQILYILELLKIAMDNEKVEADFARRFGSYGKELVVEGIDTLKEILDE